jgi:hypothetical protein
MVVAPYFLFFIGDEARSLFFLLALLLSVPDGRNHEFKIQSISNILFVSNLFTDEGMSEGIVAVYVCVNV